MKNTMLFLTTLALASFSTGNLNAACTASADKCVATCSAQAPSGGAEHCESGDDWVTCYATDVYGNIVVDDADQCSTGGGSGSGGIDPMWCALNWWICDPFAL